MIRKVDYTMHSACLAAVVTIGDAIIYLPSEYRGEAMLPGFLIASAAAVLIFLASHFLCVYSSGGAIYKKVLFTVLALILSVYALRSGAHCLLVFAGFADKILLPDGGKFIAAFIFLFTAAVLSLKNRIVLLKLSFIAAPLVAVSAVLFLLLTAKDLEADNIAIGSFLHLKELYGGAAYFFSEISLPAALIPPYFVINEKKPRLSAGLAGLCAGLVVTAAACTVSVLLFGARMSARLPFPLAGAVSTVTVGPLFTRMDWIVYGVFFISAVIKAAFCSRLCFGLIKELSPRKRTGSFR